MGAFFLSMTRTSPLAAPMTVLERQGFRHPERVATDRWELVIYRRQLAETSSLLHLDNGDFAAFAGTLIFDGRSDRDALPAVYRGFRTDPGMLDRTLGTFALVLSIDGVLHVATDPSGYFPVYIDQDRAHISTSFLALAATLPRATASQHAVYEFCLNGDITGDETPVLEIERLPWRARCRVEQNRIEVVSSATCPASADRRSREELVEESDWRLDDCTRQIAEAFDGRVTCALTAGYDTRLLFALLRRRGVAPRTMIYRYSEMGVRVAKAVADLEGVELTVIDRSGIDPPPPDAFESHVRQNMLASDGWHYLGFFSQSGEIAGRRERTEDGAGVFLHGAGGEVYREFFALPDRTYSAADVARSFYAKWHPGICSSRFDRGVFFDTIAEKMLRLVGTPSNRLDRQTIEWLYPWFRGRAWSGRENSLNAWVGASLTPFFEFAIAQPATRIPVRMKRFGDFEAELIRRVRPPLAAVISQYGHDFAGNASMKRRLVENLQWALPPRVRPSLYAARQRRHATVRPTDRWTGPEHVRAALPNGLERVSDLFNLSAPVDQRVWGRILSIEYLIANLGTQTVTEWGG